MKMVKSKKTKKLPYDAHEFRFKSLQELMDYIKNKNQNKEKYEVLKLSGNELDVIKLIKKYKLKYPTCDYNDWDYKSFRVFAKAKTGSFAIGPRSMYGQTKTKLNVRGQKIEIIKTPRWQSGEHNFLSKIATALEKDYVVLDIETTGLDPVLDDIIEIGIYENDDNQYSRYLPLENKTTNTAYEINQINEDLLKNAIPITQEEVDYIIDRFDLKNKVVLIWTGKNLFDRLFLEAYFLKHDLLGLENITFFNGRTLFEKYESLNLPYLPKDIVAHACKINTKNAHNAIEDCRIESKIVEKLLDGSIVPLMEEFQKGTILKVKAFLSTDSWSSQRAEILYDDFCKMLVLKNGPVGGDYDKAHLTRGFEWMDIHHIDEKIVDDIATRTAKATSLGDEDELKRLEQYNRKNRLVYATKVEHFILHCLLDVIRGSFSGGTHFIFGDILKMETGIFKENTKDFFIQRDKESFYNDFSLDELIKIYTTNLKFHNNRMEYCVENFYKLSEYDVDNQKYSILMEKIKSQAGDTTLKFSNRK
jgi:DNA polymerase III epsilon subunit-like protein